MTPGEHELNGGNARVGSQPTQGVMCCSLDKAGVLCSCPASHTGGAVGCYIYDPIRGERLGTGCREGVQGSAGQGLYIYIYIYICFLASKWLSSKAEIRPGDVLYELLCPLARNTEHPLFLTFERMPATHSRNLYPQVLGLPCHVARTVGSPVRLQGSKRHNYHLFIG